MRLEVQVAEAAVIGLPHPKWTERPLLVAVKSKGADLSKDQVLQFLQVDFRQYHRSRHGSICKMTEENI